SAAQRVREQDMDGMEAEILFPAMVAGPVFWRNISHDEVYKAVIRAYNDWLAEEYCAVAPDRLIGMGRMPITNVHGAICEEAALCRAGAQGHPARRLAQRQGISNARGRPVLGRGSGHGHAGDRARGV